VNVHQGCTPCPKVVDRLRKLLALTRSSNQHEAAAAAARAAELMAEHQVHTAMLEQAERAPVDEQCIDENGRAVNWKGILASGIAYSFGCAMFWRSDYDTGHRRSRIMIVGRPDDVAAVRYTYAYLCNELDRLADVEWRENTLFTHGARRFKNAFRVGAARTIAGRLHETRDQTLAKRHLQADPATERALISIARDRAELDAFLARLNLRTRSAPVVSSGFGLQAGIAAGRHVDLSRDHVRLGRPARRLKA
jgi:hypothetical protein